MTRIFTILLFFLFSLSLQAQTTHFYSRSFQTRETGKTPQKRIYYAEKNGFRFEDFQNEKLDWKGSVKGTESLEQAEKYIWFLRSRLDMHYENGFEQLSATITHYRTDGKPFEEMVARGKNLYSSQTWNKDGQPILVNGSGTREEIFDDKQRRYFAVFKDSVLVNMYSIRLQENDTIYLKPDQIASPKEGYDAFIPNLATAIGYPSLAQWVGKEGLVYINFIVDKNGRLTEIKPETRKGYRMESKALKELAKLPAWTPAYFQNKPVKSEYTLPIRYTLK